MKRLIVNADDFGLHPAVNRAVVKGCEEGCIRSTSLIASGRAAEEAAELARICPMLGVGVHLTLVAERPVLPPEKIPSLVGPDGKLLPDHVAFIKRYIAGGIRMAQRPDAVRFLYQDLRHRHPLRPDHGRCPVTGIGSPSRAAAQPSVWCCTPRPGARFSFTSVTISPALLRGGRFRCTMAALIPIKGRLLS